ncbi:hypothetical protein VCRA2122O265_340026 [Vibrio crassostreae]|nr:hypothetical protein VCRA2118O236_300025 [Vibrio crassostreae]CAK2014324.1 hypothetical protein VCRA2113O207_340036 [Vibrio crassostreae]CAK2022004.1 hypothetical protein VCRA2118O239_310026 [Vibrio crassostreae]CAK2022239.1 hypothetical protein VCRA2110O173_330026 [Vibrio crassostreae]CAK2034804.1 hypothetical protein VCRA2113O194_310037 [Vibrio crassostreae]
MVFLARQIMTGKISQEASSMKPNQNLAAWFSSSIDGLN